jgi:hypothetical protein
MESDEKEGLVHEYLDTLLPEKWETMDLYERRNFLSCNEIGGVGSAGVMARKQVCNMEIWCECFGRERASIGRYDSNTIAGILTKLGWERLPNKIRVSAYGPQYVFIPKSVLKESSKNK